MNKPRLVEYEGAAYVLGLPHRVIEPEGEGPHPTIVMLHGRHGNEMVPWVFARTLPKNWLLVAPRAIEFDPETDATDDIGYSWMFMGNEWPHVDAFADGVEAIHEFVTNLPDVYNADPERIYFLGFSQGAAAAYAYAVQYPDHVQGISGLVGFTPKLDDELIAQQPLANKPIFLSIGETDDRVPLHIAQIGRKVLASAGATITAHQYPVGHKLNGQGMRDLATWWAEIEKHAT